MWIGSAVYARHTNVASPRTQCPHCNSFLHDTPPRLVVLVAPDVRFPVAIKDGGRWDGTENAA